MRHPIRPVDLPTRSDRGCGLPRVAVLALTLLLAALLVASTTALALSPPSVAASTDGSFVVTWTEIGAYDVIFGQRYDRSGRRIGGRVQIEAPGRLPYPAVAADADGDFVVVWPTSWYPIVAQRFDSAGRPQGGSIDFNAFGDTADVAMDGAGRFVVSWISRYYGVRARRFDAAGVPLGSELAILPRTWDNPAPAIAARDQGSFVVAFTDGPASADSVLRVRRFDPAGNAAGEPLLVDSTPSAAYAAVDLADDGSFVVAWQEGDPPAAVLAQPFDAAGRRRGGEIRVSRDGLPLPQTAVAMRDSGEFFVFWTCCVDGDTTAVRGQRFDRRGARVGPEILVDSGPGRRSAPAAALAGDGKLAVAWKHAATDVADGTDVLLRLLDDAASGDGDGDGVEDGFDNCPTVPNAEQTDLAGDGYGDDCVSPDVVIPSSASFGANPVIGRGTVVLPGVRVGDDAILGEHVRLESQATAGDRLHAADYVAIGRLSTLGNDVSLGFATRLEGSVRIGGGSNLADQVIVRRGTVIGEGVRVEALVVLLAGARVGDGATLGMGARIGRRATVAPGAVVPAGTSVAPGTTFR